MNAYRIKLGEHYRLGYRVLTEGRNDSCWSRFISRQDHVETILRQLKEQKEEYPTFKWWIEQFNEDGRIWVRLKPNNSMYELFSTDEPEEEKPAKQEEPYSPWAIIPDIDIPF